MTITNTTFWHKVAKNINLTSSHQRKKNSRNYIWLQTNKSHCDDCFTRYTTTESCGTPEANSVYVYYTSIKNPFYLFTLLMCACITTGPETQLRDRAYLDPLVSVPRAYVPSPCPPSQLYTHKGQDLEHLSLHLTHGTPAPNGASYDLRPARTGMRTDQLALWLAKRRTINWETTGTTMLATCTSNTESPSLGAHRGADKWRKKELKTVWLSPSGTWSPGDILLATSLLALARPRGFRLLATGRNTKIVTCSPREPLCSEPAESCARAGGEQSHPRQPDSGPG